MAQNVVVGGEVKGDITSCKIENQVKSVEKSSSWSIQKQTTYMTYDVCNRKTVAEYRVPEFSSFGVGLLVFVAVVLGISMLMSFYAKVLDY